MLLANNNSEDIRNNHNQSPFEHHFYLENSDLFSEFLKSIQKFVSNWNRSNTSNEKSLTLFGNHTSELESEPLYK